MRIRILFDWLSICNNFPVSPLAKFHQIHTIVFQSNRIYQWVLRVTGIKSLFQADRLLYIPRFSSLMANPLIFYICIYFDGVVIAAKCTATFKIYCAPPPNLGIRMWICWLNFAQRPIFSSLRFFKEPEGLVLRIFTPWKIHRPHSGLNPRTLDLEASTLPRGRQFP